MADNEFDADGHRVRCCTCGGPYDEDRNAFGACDSCWNEHGDEWLAAVDKRKAMRVKIETRPQDWAPAARAHLFGLDSLSAEERAQEITRMSGGRRKYRDGA